MAKYIIGCPELACLRMMFKVYETSFYLSAFFLSGTPCSLKPETKRLKAFKQTKYIYTQGNRIILNVFKEDGCAAIAL